MRIGILLLGAALAALPPASAQDAKNDPSFKILLVTTDEKRGERFKEFFEKNNLSCTVALYKDVTKELVDRHDLLMPDTPEGSFKQVGEAMRTGGPRSLPKTDKPVFGIATMGYQALGAYDIAIGRIKT